MSAAITYPRRSRSEALAPVPATTSLQVSTTRAIVKEARPKQWVKNVLVFVAPAAGGALLNPTDLGRAVVGAVVFSLVSSAIYVVNDVVDAEADRIHPKKRFRPIAAGILSPRVALLAAAGWLTTAVAAAAFVLPPSFLGVVAAYVALTVSYSLWLKHERVVDIVVVAMGFVLRTFAGAVAVGVAPSKLLLATVAFGSMFMVAGKRFAERRDLAEAAAAHRAALGGYSLGYLRSLLTISGGAASVLYTVWAFEGSPVKHTEWAIALTAVPFVLGVLRYALLVDEGHGGAPEELVLSDRVLQFSALVLSVLFLGGIYL